jgi:hypothetical protein
VSLRQVRLLLALHTFWNRISVLLNAVPAAPAKSRRRRRLASAQKTNRALLTAINLRPSPLMSLPFGEETGHFLLVRLRPTSLPPSARALIPSFAGGCYRQRRGTCRLRFHVVWAQRRSVASQRRLYIGVDFMS